MFTGLKAMPIQRGLRWVMVAQAVVALLVLGFDGMARWTLPSRSPAVERPDGPVSPGDQVRRYDPDRVSPRIFDPDRGPGVEVTTDFPSRMEFTLEEDALLGDYVLVNGPIDLGDGERLIEFLDEQVAEVSGVALNSPGGIVAEALIIGQTLRARELDAAVLPGMVCVSSCPYVLAGGLERRVSGDGIVGLHQHYYDEPGYMPVYFAVENIQRGQGETMQYLIDMGVDPGVMVYGLATPPEDIYVLVEDELIDSSLATEMID